MELSDRGLSLTKASEGLRLRAYQDTGGVWTIGYGHTGGVQPNAVITPEQAEALLKLDIGYAKKCVNEHAMPCSQNQFDALTDFVFNVGPSQFLTSTLLKRHLAGRYEEAAAEFPKWKYDNGKVVQGLITRRVAERALYSLQEPQAVHLQTVEPEHSASSVVDPVPQDQPVTTVQSSPVPTVPAVHTAAGLGSKLAVFESRFEALLRKLVRGKAPKE